MKLINQTAEIWQQPEGEIGIYKQVEKAARLCYKSEDKTTEDSYRKFIGMLRENGHNSPLEHGAVYFKFLLGTDLSFIDSRIWEIVKSPYSRSIKVGLTYYVTTNYRVVLDYDAVRVINQCLCEPTEYHKKRISVHITTSRSISHELVRHRAFSFSQESQRYCAYNKDKFGGEVTFIKPCWSSLPIGSYTVEGGYPQGYGQCSGSDRWFVNYLMTAEIYYLNFIKEYGWKPQQAREVLPNATKTELVMTGFEDDWEKFFELRCSPAAHPMMQELAGMIKELIHKQND